ncbi:MAG: hypothetical protein O2890_05835 [Cyanobacteria bacterium]|nr:hypothetical protein [Cyanobacteriota bacterium]
MPDKIVPVALRLWLLFIFAFLLLGYAVVPSIVFGAIGGLAGGTVSAWWQTPGGEPQPQEPRKSASTIEQLSSRIKPGNLKGRLPFLKVFTRRDKRLTRSSRRS